MGKTVLHQANRSRRAHSTSANRPSANMHELKFYEKNKIENITEKLSNKDPLEVELPNKTLDIKQESSKDSQPNNKVYIYIFE
jgi:hypothetical protein